MKQLNSNKSNYPSSQQCLLVSLSYLSEQLLHEFWKRNMCTLLPCAGKCLLKCVDLSSLLTQRRGLYLYMDRRGEPTKASTEKLREEGTH